MHGRTFPRALAGPVSTFVLGVFAVFVPALCLAEPLTVDTTYGTVLYRQTADDTWQTLEAGSDVTVPGEIRTGESGSARLRQAGSVFELKNATHLLLPGPGAAPDGLPEKPGQRDRIGQRLGTVVYKIDRPSDELGIATPFLVSTATDAEFVIVTTEANSFVTLTEGTLEVADLSTGESRTLAPGQVASSSSGTAGIQAFNTAPPPFAGVPGGREPTSAGPLPYGSASTPNEGAADSFEVAFEGVDDIAVEQQAAAEVGPEGQDDGGLEQDPALDDQDGSDGPAVDDDMPEDEGPVDDDLPNDDDPVEDDLPEIDDDPVEDDIPGDDGPGDDLPDDDGPGDDLPGDDGPDDDLPGDDGSGDDLPDDDGPGDDLPGDDGPGDDLPGDDGPGDDLPDDDGPGDDGPDDDMPDNDDGVDDDMPGNDGDGDADDDDADDCHIIFCHDHPGKGKGDDDGGKDD